MRMYILIGVYQCKIVLGGNNRRWHNCNSNHMYGFGYAGKG